MVFGWRRVEGVPEQWDLFRWVAVLEQVELFPQSAELARSGSDGYLDTEVSVSALPDGRTLYAF
jgi:hypothetical protein